MAETGKVTDLHKLKVAELKKLLKDKGLPVAGNKPELVERLLNTGDGSLNVSDNVDKDDIEPEDDSMLDESLDPVSTDPSSPSSVPVVTPSSSSTQVDKPVTTAAPTSVSSSDKTQDAAPTSTDVSGMAARMKRFGVVSEQAKKTARQERFQTSGTVSSSGKLSSSAPAASAEVLKKRAERFGVTATTDGTSASVKAGGDVDTLKKRAERFGQVTATKLAKVEEQDRALKRKERFGAITAPATATKVATTTDVSEAKKKRLDRFGAAAAAVAV